MVLSLDGSSVGLSIIARVLDVVEPLRREPGPRSAKALHHTSRPPIGVGQRSGAEGRRDVASGQLPGFNPSATYSACEAWPIGMKSSGAPRTPIVKGYWSYRSHRERVAR